MAIQATNNFVFIIRDETEEKEAELWLPDQGKEKPSAGKIISVGELNQDKKIKKGRKALFHKGIGFEIEYEDITYLVLMASEIIGTDD